MSRVILDISRLISRVRHSTPSGVDRVEMAYARGLQRRYGDDLTFAAVHPTGRYGRIKTATALAYLDELERRWTQENKGHGQRSILQVLPWMLRLLPHKQPKPGPKHPVYVQVSPHHLTDHRKVRRILAGENARFLCMVHDLIPIEYPEFARPSGAAQHRRRMETVVACADAVIVNSAATGRSLKPWITQSGRQIATHIALLGTEALPPAMDAAPDARPYFVCIGTIEPRKNHLLLLNLWRNFAETLPPESVPRLVIIGRRGWENEQVLDMLDRCPALKGHVEELAGCPDRQLASLLRGATSLLMPSFTEGFGMPVAEALSVGVPVICSNIPAHHEVGGNAPDYVDPLDGLGWKTLIADHAAKGPRWRAQVARLTQWQAPTWDGHMRIVATAIHDLQEKY
ncbi:MAG: glycosyl transferase [Novosphingobium sp. 17-62-19]|uniref:glycosyltransferase family 4 protein n=1 Tax=Novosphingobium sp. 17-62-19 TaxID=1970406 RepID=UPI000BCD5A02|nr:glycosyltransferase family 1 protein [Novosphingobium sp. 17-62-19]OZA21525.1 MAG: glycosyl transferase [Novosphingobium sp. 17-62-19]HQS95126.1 glycosyltransferase family 1 protein [Novosphingobium sp.]